MKADINGQTLCFELHKYRTTGACAVQMFHPVEGPWGMLSTNVPDVSEHLQPGQFVVPSHNMLPETVASLLACGLFIDTGDTANFGLVTGAPIWQLGPELMAEFETVQ